MSIFGDSAFGADPDVMPSGVRPVEQVLKKPSGSRPVEQVLKSYEVESGDECIDGFGFEPIPVTTPIKNQSSFRSRAHYHWNRGKQDDSRYNQVDRTKFQIPSRWKLEDLGGTRPVEQVLKLSLIHI